MSLMNSVSPVSVDGSAETVSFRKAFSTVYVEENALALPRTQRILARFPDSVIIRCRDYREVFNRPNQSPALQKNAQALILAVSDRPRVYPALRSARISATSVFSTPPM